MPETRFIVSRPVVDQTSGELQFRFELGEHHFLEKVSFGEWPDTFSLETPAWRKLLDLTALVLGVSYFKLLAPLTISAPDIALSDAEREFVLNVYEDGLGEFYARNNLKRFGRLVLDLPHERPSHMPELPLPHRALVPIGGGKDSLVSVALLERAELDYAPFAVNPKGPILGSVQQIGRPPTFVVRTLDPEMIRLSREPGFFNGHVPSTAINSMLAGLAALLFGFDRIILSNERSASEGNLVFDGREANHQYSKSLEFETRLQALLSGLSGGGLSYFSLLRPYSEVQIARLFAQTDRFDRVFSSCNRNFRLAGHEGDLWCCNCPKCHFVFLIFAPVMHKERLVGIFGRNLLDDAEKLQAYRELSGLAGHKPWECVGEILEAAACLWEIGSSPEWSTDSVVATLRPELAAFYGPARLEAAMAGLLTDSTDHRIPPILAKQIAAHAV